MTKNQYELYDKKKKELDSLKEFLISCGECPYDLYEPNPMKIIIKKIPFLGKAVFVLKRFKKSKKYYDREYKISKELQNRITRVIKEYTEELESEMENI